MFKKHPVLSVIGILLILLILAMAVTGWVILSAGQGTAGSSPYLLVLGTTVEGTEPSSMLRDRINAAYDYLTTHPEVTCIVSGYQNNADISEAQCMFNELTEMGIDPSRIWMEDQASSTYENLTFTLALIEEKTGTAPEALGVVSSEFHLLRASMFANELAIDIFTIPAVTTDLPTFLSYFLREIVLVWYYAIF